MRRDAERKYGSAQRKAEDYYDKGQANQQKYSQRMPNTDGAKMIKYMFLGFSGLLLLGIITGNGSQKVERVPEYFPNQYEVPQNYGFAPPTPPYGGG